MSTGVLSTSVYDMKIALLIFLSQKMLIVKEIAGMGEVGKRAIEG